MVKVKPISVQILSLKMIFEQETFSIINAYTISNVGRRWKCKVLGRFGKAGLRNFIARKDCLK